MPDSSRRDARRLILRCLVLLLAASVGGCGGVGVPSIPTFPDFSKQGGGSASFDMDGVTFQVSQSGSIQTSFGSNPLSYSGPLGCRGHYFTGHLTENIEVFFRYFPKKAYLLIDNGAEPVYVFGPPARQGRRLVYSDPTPRDRKITVTVDCATGALLTGLPNNA